MGYIMDLRKIVGSRPLVMVGANVIILDSNNRILLQLRTDNHSWGLPGGSMEIGENLEDVAKRELKEETGLTANHLSLFNIFSGDEFYYKYPHGDEVYNVVATYICTDYKGRLQKDTEEVKELKFFSFKELPSKISPPDFPIVSLFIDTFSKKEC
ncbi:NUDIX hydrolase [Bacillus sp. RG28]|uniref:NUDIX hydrolase n=1 Tax=Gottfriedia endophytica TaxID=2820819 RepID=A0A940SK38_9BACI|nr:NUDIX hydrolase [Gottfriedia endophytica]MBP0724848.1 NUDIX hydrolase [Gottfriedia endophytica]